MTMGSSRPMCVYVAGPMTGIPDHNRPAFAAETARLRALGHTVLSPAEKMSDADFRAAIARGAQHLGSADYQRFMREDLLWIVTECDAISLLPGWEGSSGARVERAVAEAIGLEIWEPVLCEEDAENR